MPVDLLLDDGVRIPPATLRAIKTAFDPMGLLNPEKLIPLASEG